MPRIQEFKRAVSDAVGAELLAPKQELGKATANGRESPDRVTQLHVSAHLMTLKTGVYCIFPTLGSSGPDPVTGLPGVRITGAPNTAGRPTAVQVSTFLADGWLDGTAALVRVTDGHAQILVSVYQDISQKNDAAPRLQVLRLSKQPNEQDPGSGSPAAGRPPIQKVPAPELMAHVQRSGDVAGKIGEWIGSKGSRQWLEGFGLAPSNGITSEDIEYQGVLGRNWSSPWIGGGEYCGSRGMALPLLGLKVRLKHGMATTFECTYSATFVDGSAVGPIIAGEACEAESLAPLEAFQIVIRRRDLKEEVARSRDKKSVTAPKVKAAVKSPAKPVIRAFGRR
jgi:hypothetical protein